MQQADCERFASGGFQCEQPFTRGSFVGRAQHVASRIEPLVDLSDSGKQRLGLFDSEVEQSRPVLIGDQQHIAKALRRDEAGPRTASREQRVRPARRSEPYHDGRNRFVESQTKRRANGQNRSLFARREFVAHSGPLAPALRGEG